MLKKKQQEESKSKPKFLTKEQRARIAMEKRAKEVESRRVQEQAKLDALRNAYSTKDVQNNSIAGSRSLPGGRPVSRNQSKSSENLVDPKKRADEPAIDGSELASVRARYMGISEPKAKKRKVSDRKFVFDWSTDADTSASDLATSTPLSIAFGRGHFGGFDGANNRRGGLDRHWSEKELIEMTERDWRIFREDFNISTKGLSPSFPMGLTLKVEASLLHFVIGKKPIYLLHC